MESLPDALTDVDWWLEKTKIMAKEWCPGCAPERDPVVELLAVSYCEPHAPKVAGPDDARATVPKYVYPAMEGPGL